MSSYMAFKWISTSSRFRNSSGFFKISAHIFMIFEKKIEVVILITPKEEVERKSECFCRVKL